MKEDWAESTERAAVSSLKLFLDVVGDIPANDINREIIKQYRDEIRWLPKNRNLKRAYRDKSFEELAEMEIPEADLPMRSTINKHLRRVKALLHFGNDADKIAVPGNPFYRILLIDDRRPSEKRAAYTTEELNNLFGSEVYKKDSFKHPYQFWAPLIAIFHGLRCGEIAQLHLDDIREEGGVYVFDINKNEDDKSVKTKNGVRLVPIHPFLINDLQFNGFVDRLKSAGEKRLFPELSHYSVGGYGARLSSWYNRVYKGKCGINTDDGKLRDLHSFRANWYIRAVEQGANWLIQKDVVGHSSKDAMADTYLKTANPSKILDQVISKIDLEELIDLSHIKKSRFVTGKG